MILDIFRTLGWFIYFFGYLILHKGELNKGLRLLEAGDEAALKPLVNGHVFHWCSRLLELAGVTVEVEGRENIPEGRACVFVANHRGYFDIPIVLTSLDEPHALMSKEGVRKIPFVRDWMELLHCVFVVRDDPKASLRALNEATANVKAGRSMIIFPEGTRHKGPEGTVGEFKGGAFRAAFKNGAPVVPVAISRSRDIMENNHMLMHPARITVRILPPVETAGMTRDQQKLLPQQVQELVRRGLDGAAPAPEEGENPYHRLYTADRSFAELARREQAAGEKSGEQE